MVNLSERISGFVNGRIRAAENPFSAVRRYRELEGEVLFSSIDSHLSANTSLDALWRRCQLSEGPNIRREFVIFERSKVHLAFRIPALSVERERMSRSVVEFVEYMQRQRSVDNLVDSQNPS